MWADFSSSFKKKFLTIAPWREGDTKRRSLKIKKRKAVKGNAIPQKTPARCGQPERRPRANLGKDRNSKSKSFPLITAYKREKQNLLKLPTKKKGSYSLPEGLRLIGEKGGATINNHRRKKPRLQGGKDKTSSGAESYNAIGEEHADYPGKAFLRTEIRDTEVPERIEEEKKRPDEKQQADAVGSGIRESS